MRRRRVCRQLVRLMSRHTWLYTEMVVDKTLIHNPSSDKFLWFPPEQRPIVCQLGGSDPGELAQAAAIVARYGYDEINLNCGCAALPHHSLTEAPLCFCLPACVHACVRTCIVCVWGEVSGAS